MPAAVRGVTCTIDCWKSLSLIKCEENEWDSSSTIYLGSWPLVKRFKREVPGALKSYQPPCKSSFTVRKSGFYC